jgi:hypothetical protein
MRSNQDEGRAMRADARGLPAGPVNGPGMAVLEGEDESGDVIVHATAIRWQEHGILLRGPSGAGKSDLALRLIERGALLVADDLVRIGLDATGRLMARSPGEPGLIELRGQGIFRQPALALTRLDLCLDLVADATLALDRLPAPATALYCGRRLPLYRLEPFAASATARLAVLLAGERVA